MRASGPVTTSIIVDAVSGGVLVDAVEVASSPWQRLRGLLGRRRLMPGEALWLTPCNGVHTFGMRYAIAIWVLDAGGTLVRVEHVVQPWRVVRPVQDGHTTVEMLPETSRSAGRMIGDRVRLAAR